MSDDKKWLYGKFKSGGLNVGSYEDFDKSLSNEEDRKWYHEKATKMGLNVGSYDDFNSLFSPADTTKADAQAAAETKQQAGAQAREAKAEQEAQAQQRVQQATAQQPEPEPQAESEPYEENYTPVNLDTETDPNALRRRQQAATDINQNPAGYAQYVENAPNRRETAVYRAERARAKAEEAKEEMAEYGFLSDPAAKGEARKRMETYKAVADEYQKAADLSPQYQNEKKETEKQLDDIDKRIGELSDALVGDASRDVNLRQSPFYGTAASKMLGTQEGRNLTAASNLIEEARMVLNRGNRYTDKMGKMEAFGNATLETLAKPEFWTMGLSTISDGKRIRAIQEKVVKEVGSLSKEDIEAGNLDKILSPDEMAVMEAYLAWGDAQILRANNQSKGYKAGEIGAQSVAFMRDMMMTAGISGGVNSAVKKLFNGWVSKTGRVFAGLGGNAVSKWATAEGLNLAQKVGRGAVDLAHKSVKNLVAAGLDAAVAVNFTPTLYANYSKQLWTPDENNLLRTKGEIWNENWWQNWKEYFTERGIGEAPGKVLGHAGRTTGATEFIGGLAGTKLADFSRKYARALRTGKMASMGAFNNVGEYFEEYVGALMDKYLFGQKTAMVDFWDKENLATMVGAFAPMMGVQAVAAGVNVAALNKADRRYEKRKEALRFLASERMGITLPEDTWKQFFDYFDTKVSGAESAMDYDVTGEEMVGQIKKIHSLFKAEIMNNGGMPLSPQEQEELFRAEFDLFRSAAEHNAVQAAYEETQEDRRRAKRDEIQQSLGGKQFWIKYVDDDASFVNVYETERGIAYGVSSKNLNWRERRQRKNAAEQAEDEYDEINSVVFEDGTVGFINDSEIRGFHTYDLDEFLDQKIGEDQAVRDAASMQEQRTAQVQQLSSMFEIGVASPLNGLVPTDILDDGVIFADGTEMSWEQIGEALGSPIEVLTEDEAAEAEAGADAAREDAAEQLEVAINEGLKKKSLIQGKDTVWNIVKVIPGTIDQETGKANFLLKNEKGDYVTAQLDYNEFINPDMSEPGEEGAEPAPVEAPVEPTAPQGGSGGAAAVEEAPAEPGYEIPLTKEGAPDFNKMLEENPAAYVSELEKALGEEGRETAKKFIGEKIKAIGKEADEALKKMDTNKVVSLRNRAKQYQDVLDSLEEPVSETAPENNEIPTFDRLLGDGLGFSDIDAYVNNQIDRITKIKDALEKPVFDGVHLKEWEQETAKYRKNMADADALLSHFRGMKALTDRVKTEMPSTNVDDIPITKDMLEPLNATELAASMFANGGFPITVDSYNSELIARGTDATGQTGENKKLIGFYRTKENGGHTIAQAAERLVEMKNEGYAGAQFADEDARDIILDFLSSVETVGDINHYIERERRDQFRKEENYFLGKMAAAVQERFGLTLDQYEEQLDELRRDMLVNLLENGGEITNFEENEDNGTVPETETDGILPEEPAGAEPGAPEGPVVGEGAESAEQTDTGEGPEETVDGGSDGAPGVLGGSEEGTGAVETEEEDMPEEISGEARLDEQGNPIAPDGSLIIEKLESIDDLTDEDFDAPRRTVELPKIPDNLDKAIGADGKPVIIKKNIFEKNRNAHIDLSPDDSRTILRESLYNTNITGQTQPKKRPNYWVAIKTGDPSRIVILEVNEGKDNIEIVGWHYIDEGGIERLERQAEREDGQLLILTSDESEAAEALSTLPSGESESKDTESSEESNTSEEKSEETTENQEENASESEENVVTSQEEEAPAEEPGVTRPLTEDEIRNSGAPAEFIAPAIAYINGNQNLVNTIAYQNVIEYVRNKPRNLEQGGSDADQAQLGEGNAPSPGGETGRGGGQGGDVAGEEGDRGGLDADSEGGVSPVSGEGGDQGVPQTEPELFGNADESANGGGSGNAGSTGGNGKRRGGQKSRGASASVPGGRGAQPGGNPRRTIEDINSDIEATLKELEEEFKKGLDKANSTLSIDLTGGLKNYNWGKILPTTFKLGYLYIEKSVRTLEEFVRKMYDKIGGLLQGAGLSDVEVDRYIKDLWDSPYEINGETHTLAEWSSIIGKRKLHDQINQDIESKKKAQKKADAEVKEIIPGDEDNIIASLPFLLEAQQHDVLLAERQFFDETHQDRAHGFGQGYMFTNATGTGKTFTGLGIIKRFVRQGKGRVLIVTPTQTKVSDWAKDGKKMDITVTPLEDTNDKGSGVVATTYANFYQNPKLLEDTFDLIVYDESHRLMENQKGTGTENAGVHHLMANRDVKKTLARLERSHPLWQEYREVAMEAAELDTKEWGTQRTAGQELTPEEQVRSQELHTRMVELERQMSDVLPALREKAKQETGKTKCVFLSATPFASHRSLAYTEGYIFSYPSEGTDRERNNYFADDDNDIYLDLASSSKKIRDTFIHTKNRVYESYEDEWKLKAEGRWLLETFKSGYVRSSRSVTPSQFILNPAKLEEEEIAFSEKLQHDLSTMSGRPIDIEQDYSRDFPIEELYIGMDFNAAIDGVSENGQFEILGNYARGGAKGPVSDEILDSANIVKGGGFGRTLLDFNWASFLFQAIKASVVGKRIQKHLAMGRKVTLFHSRMNQPKGQNVVPMGPPFATALQICREDARKLEVQGMHDIAVQIETACTLFELQFPNLMNWEKTLNFQSPVEQIIQQLATPADYDAYDAAHKKWADEKAAAVISGKKFTKKEPELRASGVLLFNGEDDLADKPEVPAKFNDDNANNNVIIVQTQSGKEGISLHDQTGKYPRVLINISLPYSPIEFIQVEGRIYRLGVKSNAIFEYPLLGLALEYSHFAWKINQRAATTENLALGAQGRALMRSIKKGILERSGIVPLEGQGVGGKEFDSRSAYDTRSSFDKAIEDYQKTMTNPRSETKGLPGYFATPEPLGFKMVEWARLAEGENVLEPSAGIGAIARYIPKENGLTALEPTLSLKATLELLLSDQNKKVLSDKFDWFFSYGNKFDTVIMCPPIGEEGRTATAHVKKAFDHIGDGGRVVAVIPTSVAETMSFKKWLDGTAKEYENVAGSEKQAKNPHLVANIKLPLAAYPNAGEPMSLVVYDKIPNKELRKNAPEAVIDDWTDIGKIEKFFEKIRNFELPPRIVSKQAQCRKVANKYKREFNNLLDQGVVSFPDKPAVETTDRQVIVRLDKNIFRRIQDDLDLYTGASYNEKGREIKGTEHSYFRIDYENFTGDEIKKGILRRYVYVSNKLEAPENEFAGLVDASYRKDLPAEDAAKVRKIYELWAAMVREMSGYTDGQLRRLEQGLPAEIRPGEIDQTLDARGVKEKFELNNNGNKRREELFTRVWRIMSQAQPTIKVGRRGEADGSAGYFSFGPNVLHFNSDEWNRSEPERNAEVTVHEMIHMGTLWALEAYDAKKANSFSSARQYADIESVLTPDVERACKTLNDVFAQLSKGQNSSLFAGMYFMVGEQNEKYGHPRPAELSAEMASDKAVEALKKFPVYVYGSEENPLYFAERMEDGDEAKEVSAYDLIYPAVTTILDNFNMEAFEKMRRYNRLYVTSAPLGAPTQQADQIYARAVVDGDIHIAPNGERSLLEPDDWAEVRTDDFKEKFGDWEKDGEETGIELDKNGEPVIKEGRVLYRPSSHTMSRRQSESREAIEDAARTAAEALGVKIEFHKDGKGKGWYNTSDGSVHLAVNNATDVADAMATVFHEVVGHKGLRQMLGKDFDKAMADIYAGAHESIRKQIDSIREQIAREKQARGENPETSLEEATEEYLAELAEEGINGEMEQSLWQRIKQAFFDLLRRAGLNIPLTDEDLMYVLWQSKRNLENTDKLSILELADRALMRDALRKQAESSHNPNPEDNGPFDDGGGGVRYRKSYESADDYLPTSPFFNRQEYYDRFTNATDREEKRAVIKEFIDKSDPHHGKVEVVYNDEKRDFFSKLFETMLNPLADAEKAKMLDMLIASLDRNVAVHLPAPYSSIVLFPDNAKRLDNILSDYSHEWTHNDNEINLRPSKLAVILSKAGIDMLDELEKVAGKDARDSYESQAKSLNKPKSSFADEIIAYAMMFSYRYGKSILNDFGFKPETLNFIEKYYDERCKAPYRPALQGRGFDRYNLPGGNTWGTGESWWDDQGESREVQGGGSDANGPSGPVGGQGGPVRYRAIRHKPKSPRIKREIVRQSTVDEENDEALRLYNRAANSVFTRLGESFIDMMNSLTIARDAMVKESGKEMKDSEDFVTMFNTQSSRMHEMSRRFADRQLKAMREALKDITDEFEDIELADISKYVSIKSGLERNVEFAKRDAREWYQEEFRKEVEKVKADKKLTDDEKQDKIDALQKELEDHLQAIKDGTDEKFLEYRKDDYGGITGWMSRYEDEAGNPIDELPGMEPGESVEEYNARIRKMRKPLPGADDLEGAESLAEAFVSDFENKISQKRADNLWKTINDCTKHILRTQYKSNVISKAQFDSLIDRLQYYVPLRGFEEDTAGDIYSYYGADERRSFLPPLLRAGGRMSRPDSPFGFIAGMADSAFSEAAKNDSKRALFRFISNRKDNSFATIADSYYRKTDRQNAKGGDIYEAVNAYTEIDPDTGAPYVSDGMSMKAQREGFAKFKEAMLSDPDVVKGKKKLNLRDSVAMITDSEAESHIVRVKVLGEEYEMVFHGNPRMAQAINGELNSDSQDNAAKRVLRFLASMSTSRNPAFWIDNFRRDFITSVVNLEATEDTAYVGRMIGNLKYAFRTIQLYLNDGEIKKAKDGSKLSDVEAMWNQFVDNGGITGMAVISRHEQVDKQIADFLKTGRYHGKDESWFVKHTGAVGEWIKKIGDFGESIEQVIRFATFMTSRQMGRGINQSIRDAKEVTVNFNRKGSGKAITRDEAKTLGYSLPNGKWHKLTAPEQMVAVLFSSLAPIGRNIVLFFNANMQGLYRQVNNFKSSPGNTTAMMAGLTMMGFGYTLLTGLLGGDDDDDKKYFKISEYNRNHRFAIPTFWDKGTFFLWPIPPEFAPFYEVGNIWGDAVLHRRPDQNPVWASLAAMGEILPANPAEPTSLIPAQAKPIVESAMNKNYMGQRLHGGNEWNKDMPGYTKAFNNTWDWLVDLSEMLNNISGGDYATKGWLNFNPAVAQHLIEGFGGGLLSFMGQIVTTAEDAIGGKPVQLRTSPIANRFFLDTDEYMRDSYVNKEYYFFKGIADQTKSRLGKYQYNKPDEDYIRVQQVLDSKDYKYLELYNDYKKEIDAYSKDIKNAADINERKELMAEQDALKKAFVDECIEVFYSKE